MAKLSAKARKSIPKSEFGVPSKAPGPGSYPMPDQAHARVAKAYAARFASPAEKAAVDKKANAILGKSKSAISRAKSGEGSKVDKAQDQRGMKATGMTAKAYENSARDKREDRARMTKTCPGCGKRTSAVTCPSCGRKM